MKEILKKVLKLLPDKVYISIKYFYHFKKLPNLKTPTTYNEKLQWLKIHDRRPVYMTMVDKYEAKRFIADRVGNEYVIPTFGIWECFDEIDFDALPSQFVLKTTHDCGGVVVCKDKSTFDKAAAKEFLEKHLKRNYYYEGREWPYKNIKPRILAERYLEDRISGSLWDYKFFVFNGTAKAMFIATDRQSENEETKFDFYDMNFDYLGIKNGHSNSDKIIQKPIAFDMMKKLSEKLAEGFSHIRVDFFEVNGKVYVGELTLYHYSGFIPFEPEAWDDTFGNWLDISKID